MNAQRLKISFEKDSHIPTCFVHVYNDEYGKPIDFVFDAINDAFLELFHVEKENVLGKRYLECMNDIDLQWIVDVAEVVKTKTGIEKNYHFPESDKFVKTVFSPGTKKGTCSISYIDVTKECRELRELRERDKLYNFLLKEADYICKDPDYNHGINQALSLVQKVTGCDRIGTAKFNQDGLMECVHQVDNPAVHVVDVPDHTFSVDDYQRLCQSLGTGLDYLYLDTDIISNLGEDSLGKFRKYCSRNFVGVPFIDDNKVIGFFGMCNFRKEKLRDILYMLRPTAILIFSRMKNYSLEKKLHEKKD
jgi:hypothetical protein